jgi:hypothetical protein
MRPGELASRVRILPGAPARPELYDPSNPSELVVDESQGFGRGSAGRAGFASGDASGGKWTDRMDALLAAAQSSRPATTAEPSIGASQRS